MHLSSFAVRAAPVSRGHCRPPRTFPDRRRPHHRHTSRRGSPLSAEKLPRHRGPPRSHICRQGHPLSNVDLPSHRIPCPLPYVPLMASPTALDLTRSSKTTRASVYLPRLS